MWELNYKEGCAPKNWCFWAVVLEKTLESPLDCREIQSVHPKGDQSWIFIERTDVEAETPVLWPLMRRADSSEKTLMLGKIEGRKRGQQRLRWLDGIFDSIDMSLYKLNRGWDSWMARLTQWTWVCVDPVNWLWTGRPGMLQSMGSQRVGGDWAIELKWIIAKNNNCWNIKTMIWINCHFRRQS